MSAVITKGSARKIKAMKKSEKIAYAMLALVTVTTVLTIGFSAGLGHYVIAGLAALIGLLLVEGIYLLHTETKAGR